MNKKNIKGNENWENIRISSEQMFHREFKQLRRLVKIWRDNESEIKTDGSEGAILLQYARYIHEVNNYDRLSGLFYIKPIRYQQHMKNIKSEKEIFLGIPFLEQKPWKINFNKNFIEKIKLLARELIIDIFYKLYLVSEGYLEFKQGKPDSFTAYQKASKFELRYFTTQIQIDHENFFMLVSIGTHRMPHYDFNAANGNKIEFFQHFMMITCEDLIHPNHYYSDKKMKSIIECLEDSYQENPRMNYPIEELSYDQELMKEKIVYYHSKKRDNQQRGIKIFPTAYKKIIPRQLDVEQFSFTLEKFIQYQIRLQFMTFSKMNAEEQYLEEKEIQEEENLKMIEQLELQTAKNQSIKFKNHQKIIQNLKLIPNFKYTLTNQQKQVLCREGNLIIVGRSGTGKTTCAMLRLYGIQFLVKLAEYNNLKRQGKLKQQKQKCVMMRLDQILLMKNIFLTFSGRLIDEIKKQYDDMLYQIREKHAQKCQICKLTFKANKGEDDEEDPIDKLKRQEVEQEKKVISLQSIRSHDFPGFFTIENFIRIVDMTISRPFFCHQKNQNNINQMNVVIKHAYINYYQYTTRAISRIDTKEAVYVDYNFFFTQIWQDLPKELTRANKQFCLLTPSIVWSQIFSIIKGSLNSYLCPGGFISLKMYIDDHQSIFQRQSEKMQEYKVKVYRIFKSYLNWCKNERSAYDLMDVVNHILRQIQFYGYSGPRINYIFIDQVQDLTTLTTFLISKMVVNNIFYCGDTAQAITKGVSFKFEDLKFIFNQQYCRNALKLDPPKDIIYLTVNFRSHNYILQLANSVVLSIQNLFEGSINSIKKEKSDLIGPKPFILLNQQKSLLFYLICGPSEQINQQQLNGEAHLREIIIDSEKRERIKFQKKKKNKKQKKQMLMMEEQAEGEVMSSEDDQQQPQTRRFNSEQIVIVRNVEQKINLPRSLKRGIVLIPQTAKGLQFDEVILYNFFSSCPIYQKWNSLLQHLEPQFSYQSEKDFQEELSRRNKQEKDVDEALTQEVKKLLGYDQAKKAYKIWGLKAKDSLKGVTINLYHQLASQLKILYTVITRARSVFVIFDSKIPKNLLRLWQNLDLACMIDEKNILENYKLINDYVNVKEKHIKYVNQDTHWLKAGGQMLARKDYENAKKCYKNIKRYDLVDRIQALQLQIRAENQMYRINNGIKNLPNLGRDDRKIAKFRLQKQKKQAYKIYAAAGKIYQKYKRYKDAAQVYFKAEQYQLALQYNIKIQKKDKIAVCCKKLKRYKEAIDIFQETNDIQGIIGCYIQQKKWTQLFNLLIENTQYINQLPHFNSIALDCIKKVLSQTIKSEDVKRKQQYFLQWFGLSLEKQLPKKRICPSAEFSSNMNRFNLESYFYSLKKMESKLESQVHKFEQLRNAYHSFKAQIQILVEQQSQTIKKYDAFKIDRDRILKEIQQIQEKIIIEEKKYLPQELPYHKFYCSLRISFQRKLQQKKKTYQQNQQIQSDLNNIHESIFELEPLQKKAREKYQYFYKTYNQEKTENSLLFLSKRLKSVIYQLKAQLVKNNNADKKPIKNPPSKSNTNTTTNNEYEFNINDDMVSISDISEMTQIWDFNESNIGGLYLFPQEKQDLIKLVNQKLSFASQFLQNKLENTYSLYHHKYIEQKLFKILVEQSSSQNYNAIMALKKCNSIEENMVCLLMCDYYKEFVCLSPKYILGNLLEYSHNFKQNRYFSNEIYQIENDKSNNQGEKIYIRNQYFLASLDNNGLMHKVPRLAFENKFYYESITSQVTFGLILQGYINQALLFCELGPASRIAYLFSSYQKLTYYLKQITNQLAIPNTKFDKKTYLFTQDERIFTQYPEFQVLNIFSIQNIFFAYDECQVEPFLSKQKTPNQIDIKEEWIQECINFKVDKKIDQMKVFRQESLYQIRRLELEVYQFQACLKTQKNEKILLDRAYAKEKKKLKYELQELNQKLATLNKELAERQTASQRALFQMNTAIIPRNEKVKYQTDLNDLLFKIADLTKLRKVQESQRLKKKRMNLDEEYKEKRQQQKSTYDAYERSKVRVSQKQKQIRLLIVQRNKIYFRIEQYQQSIKAFTPEQIKDYYNKFIIENKNQIKSIKQEISIQLQIKDPQKQKEAVLKLLMNQQKRKRHAEYMNSLRNRHMNQIQKKSNIPKSEHFKFLTLYLKGQLSQRNQQRNGNFDLISHTYYNILINGINILSIENQKDNKEIANIKICNIIIFYLSYICNKEMRWDVNDFIRISTQTYEQNYKKRSDLVSYIKQLQTSIEFCSNKLKQIPPHKKHKGNQDYNNYQYKLRLSNTQLVEYMRMLQDCKGFPQQPMQLLNQFLDTLFKKIKTLEASQMRFMELLFGFFQCRIIRDCELLDFLANEYVLVRHSSIVMQKLLQNNDNNVFAYYFDQQNKTVLCRYEDVQSIILGFIQQKHNNLYNASYQMAGKEGKLNNRQKFMSPEILGYKSKNTTSEDKQMFELTKFLTYDRRQVQMLYDNAFIGNNLMKEVKQLKRQILIYLLKNKHQNSDEYYFASHQLREYYFLEKMIINMKSFNYETLREVKKKKDMLKIQYEMYTSRNKN